MLPSGPKGQPLVGGYSDFQRDRLGFLLRCSREYGDIAYTHFLGHPFYLLNHPDFVHLVLVEHAEHFKKLDKPRKGQESLSNSDGVVWQRRRKLVAPAFHSKRVLTYGETMVACAAAVRDGWHDGEVVDASDAVGQVTMQVSAKTLLNADVSNMADEIGRVIAAGQEFLAKRASQPLGAALQLVRDWRIFADFLKLRTTILQLVQQRRAQGSPDTGDLLSMLMLARDEEGDGAALSDQEVADEALGLFIAGYETTANALAWTLYLLAQHPAMQDALHSELDNVLSGRLPSVTDPLPYAEMVVKEAMRLYPPAWILVRRAAPDIPIGGYTLPKKAIVVLSPYTMQRDPRYFPEPERFDPLRFTPEREKDVPRYAYFPFGGGPRVCIGNQFAMLEARLVLATLMQHYRVEPAPQLNVKPQPLITLRPDSPMWLRVSRR